MIRTKKGRSFFYGKARRDDDGARDAATCDGESSDVVLEQDGERVEGGEIVEGGVWASERFEEVFGQGYVVGIDFFGYCCLGRDRRRRRRRHCCLFVWFLWLSLSLCSKFRGVFPQFDFNLVLIQIESVTEC